MCILQKCDLQGVSMGIIKWLENYLQGRGVYPIFMVITAWSYAVILLCYLMCEVFLYVFKVKLNDKNFKNEIHKNLKKGDKCE